MASTLATLTEHQDWLGGIKQHVASACLRAALVVNRELYWEQWAQIVGKQAHCRRWWKLSRICSSCRKVRANDHP